jgi:hypothetical protein
VNRRDRRRVEAAQRAQERRLEKDAEKRAKGEHGMGATIDKGFERYRDLYRRAYKKTSDQEIGEGWMRGEVAKAGDYMMIHPVGEQPPAPSDDDIFLSAVYEPQWFLARTALRHFQMMVDGWPDFVRQVCNAGISTKGLISDDPRHDARQFIFDMIMDNRAQSDPMMAALTGSAIAWLATTSPVGVALGKSHRVAHYSITDQTELTAGGRKARNFRLMLAGDPSQYAEMARSAMVAVPKW